jgi:hypothetical protein
MNDTDKEIPTVGYLVVRLPKDNLDEQGRGSFTSSPPCIGSVCYGGLDRMPWFDVEEDHFAGKLPAELEQILHRIKDSIKDFTGIALCTQLPIAIELLDYSNKDRKRNEIIAVGSEKLAAINGSLTEPVPPIEWLGFDIVSVGNWSLLREGLFVRPEEFQDALSGLTQDGLFSDAASASAYAQKYLAAAARGHVEELPDSVYGIEPIRIGRILR